jgi:hypothetical protein
MTGRTGDGAERVGLSAFVRPTWGGEPYSGAPEAVTGGHRALGPFSSITRREMLSAIRRRAEA